MTDKPSYFAIIPASVRYNDKLCPNAKLLYGEITALANKEGYCWASNEYFATLYNKHKKTISQWISQLNKCGHIKIHIENRENGFSRKIFISEDPIREFVDTPPRKDGYPLHENADTPPQKHGHINTMNNTLDKDNEKNVPYLPLAELLYTEHKKHDENFLAGKDISKILNSWANDIRLLVTVDKRDPDLVKTIITWCQSEGNFWVPNILSGFKLRQKFPVLYGQYKSDKKPVNRSSYDQAWKEKYGKVLKD